jgi:hypothetical protein
VQNYWCTRAEKNACVEDTPTAASKEETAVCRGMCKAFVFNINISAADRNAVVPEGRRPQIDCIG